jgi:hypothetical protein
MLKLLVPLITNLYSLIQITIKQIISIMKTIKTLLVLFSFCLLCMVSNAQGNCQGNNIKVFKGATGCGCKCMKECVTPAELPTYLADGWNTEGCWQCCKFYHGGWVDASSKTTIDQIVRNPETNTVTITYTLESQGDVKIKVLDMTGRIVATIKDEHREDLENELIWDESKLEPGVYVLTLEADGITDSKKISVTE